MRLVNVRLSILEGAKVEVVKDNVRVYAGQILTESDLKLFQNKLKSSKISAKCYVIVKVKQKEEEEWDIYIRVNKKLVDKGRHKVEKAKEIIEKNRLCEL